MAGFLHCKKTSFNGHYDTYECPEGTVTIDTRDFKDEAVVRGWMQIGLMNTVPRMREYGSDREADIMCAAICETRAKICSTDNVVDFRSCVDWCNGLGAGR